MSKIQQQAVLTQLEYVNATGKLTTAQLTEIMTTKSRSKADAEALLLNSGLISSETTEAMATNTVTAAKLQELVQTKALTKAEADLIAAKAGVISVNQKESATLFSGTGAKLKGVGSTLKNVGSGALALAKAHPVIAGITAILTIGTVALGVYKNKQEETAKAIKKAYEEAKIAIEDINNSFANTKTSTKEIAKEYAELAQGVNLLTNENEKLSVEKHERFLELSNQLSSLYPSLTKRYDENGNAILDLSGDVDTIVGSLDNLIERQRNLANQEIVDKMPELFKGYANNVTDYKKDLNDAEGVRDEILEAYALLNSWEGSTVWWNNGGQVVAGADKTVRTIADYTNALDALGIKYKKVAVDLNNDTYHNADGFSIEADYNEFGTELHDIYVSKFNQAQDDVKYAKMQLESETSSINQYLNTWLQTEFSYNKLEDEGLKQAIQEALFDFDWSTLPKNVDKDNWEDVSEYLRRNILFSVSNIDDKDVSQALIDIYTKSLSSGALLNAIEKVQDYFGDEHPISVSLDAKVKDVTPLITNVKNKLKGIEFDDRVGELSLSDLNIAANLEVSSNTIKSWDELIAMIEKAKNATSSSIFTLSDSQNEAIETYKTTVSSVQDILEKVRDKSPGTEKVLVDSLIETFKDSGLNMDSLLVDAIHRKGNEVTEADMMAIADAAWHALVSAMGDSSEAYGIIQAIREKYADFDFEEVVNVNKAAYDELFKLYGQIQKGETFTQDELQPRLDKYGDLEGELVKVGDEYSIQEDALVSLINKYGELTNAAITSEIARVKAEQETNAYIGMTEEELTEAMEGADTATLVLIEKAFEHLKLYGDGYVEYLQGLREGLLNDSDKLKSDDSTFDEEIDWYAQSVDVLSGRLSDLETELDNTKGYNAQIAKIDEVITAQENLKEAYEKSAEAYEDRFLDALDEDILRNNGFKPEQLGGLIASGQRFGFEDLDYIDNVKVRQQVYDAIQEAIDWYNKYKDADDNVVQLDFDIDNKELEKLQLNADKFSAIRENIETELDGAISDDRRLKILENPDDLKKAINDEYDALIKVADAEKDVYEIEKLELERKQALSDVDQQRLDLIREIDDAEISRLERNRTELQNQIDLNDGKGTTEQYLELISNERNIARELKADLERESTLLSSIELTLGKNSTKYREQEQKVNDIADNIAECEKNTKEWHLEILNLPLKDVEDTLENLNDKLQDVQDQISDMDTIIAGAQAYIQDEIDAQEELKGVIQDQLDDLQDANDERERALALEKAQYELERARSQRVKKVYKGEGQGFVYEQDQDAVRSAQENLDNLNYENTIHQLEKQIEYYDDIISDLQEIMDAWGNIASEAQDYLDIQKAIAAVGVSGIFSMDVVDGYTDVYTGMLQTQENLTNEVETLEDVQEQIEDVIELYNTGKITFEECLTEIDAIVKNTELADSENLANIIAEIKELYGNMKSDITTTNDDIKKDSENSSNTAKNTIIANYEAITKALQEEVAAQKLEIEGLKKTIDEMYSSITESLGKSLGEFSKNVSDSCDILEGKISDVSKRLEDVTNGTIVSSKKNAGIITGRQPEVTVVQHEYHNGLENGLVGEKNAGEGLKKVALRKLEPDEIPAILEVDEAVLTQMQQRNVMHNIGSAFKAGINTSIIKNNSSTPVVQNINLTLPNVTNESGYNRLVQELQGLQLDALQYAKKR